MKNTIKSWLDIQRILAGIAMSFALSADCFGLTVTIYPDFPSQWGATTEFTGRVNSNYTKSDDVLWVGDPTIGAPSRGWIVFNTDNIPTNATIQSIKLYLYPFNPGGSNHNLMIRDFGAIPVNSYAGDLVWSEIGSGQIFYDGYALASVSNQWVSISLNATALSNLQFNLNQSQNGVRYWGIGLYEYGDDDNNSQIRGYTNSNRPYCEVTYTIPQCTISVSSGSTVSSSVGSTNISVTSNSVSTWSATEGCSWLTISPTSGTGNDNVTVDYDNNTSSSSRSCTISFSCGSSSDSYVLTQQGLPQCTISVPSIGTVSSNAGSVNVSVTSNGSSAWTTSESCSWVTISPTGSTGSDIVIVNYDQNTSSSSRTCTISFYCGSASDSYTLTQTGTTTSQCTVSVPSGSTVASSSGSTSIYVTSNSVSTWYASQSCSWVSISPSSGTGNDNVSVTYDQNTSTSSRTCIISFSCGSSSDSYTLTQQGQGSTNCIYSISKPSSLFFSNGGPGDFEVTTSPSNCSWTPSANVSWITNVAAWTNGITFDVLSNPDPTERQGIITVADQTHTVIQKGYTYCNCLYSDFTITVLPDWQTHTSDLQWEEGGCKVYNFPVNKDHTYIFKTACGDGAYSNFCNSLSMEDANCNYQFVNEDFCGGDGEVVEWIATYTGYASLKIEACNVTSGNYTLAFKSSSPVSTKEITSVSNFSLFPNPTTGTFTLSMIINQLEPMQLHIFNSIGQVVYEELVRSQGKYQKTIDLSSNSKGIFLIQLVSKEGVIGKKILVQ